MELLHELAFSNTNMLSCNYNRSGMIKILASGELAAEGKDHRLFIMFNGDRKSYRSFVHMGGDAGLGEWDETGIYVGRNGWGMDATFALDYTFTINPKYQKVTGSGMSSFALGDNRFLGYESHGFYVTGSPVSSIHIGFDNCKVRLGDLKIYQM